MSATNPTNKQFASRDAWSQYASLVSAAGKPLHSLSSFVLPNKAHPSLRGMPASIDLQWNVKDHELVMHTANAKAADIPTFVYGSRAAEYCFTPGGPSFGSQLSHLGAVPIDGAYQDSGSKRPIMDVWYDQTRNIILFDTATNG